jgi:hypothetical protein
MSTQETVFERIRGRLKKDESVPTSMTQRMRRCFMTGKQCIFSTQSSMLGDLGPGQARDSVFVIMPFRPNLDTFFEWSLKRYLVSFGIAEEKIRRADYFSDIGYVMCEKICRRIQEAGLIAVDLSLENSNVYYELGIAVGLGKPLFLLCDKALMDNAKEKTALWNAVGIRAEDVVGYPSVGFLDAKDNNYNLAEKAILIRLEPHKPDMRILPLLVGDSRAENPGRLDGHEDIHVSFSQAVCAAVGVAIDDIRAKAVGKTGPESYRRDPTADQLRAAVEALRSSMFSSGDITDLRSFATKLIYASDSVARFLRDNLSDTTRQLLEAWNPQDGESQRLLAALIEELNKILQGRPIYDPQRFSGVTIAQETRDCLSKNPEGEDLIRLNRLLLEDAYPFEIARNQILRETGRISDQLWTLRNTDPYPVLTQKEDRKIEYAEFHKTMLKVNSAFVCIVDLAGENPLSYFWLGYCHARNINVIPVYRAIHEGNQPPSAGPRASGKAALADIGDLLRGLVTEPQGGRQQDHILAFDIRALWNVRYNAKAPKELANTLRAVIEELLIKDVMTQERRAFWERLTRSGQIHIFTGAVHHEDLNREVVGDWDLRTVSELVQYLSSSEESVVPVLERPIYAPETIKVKLKKHDTAKSVDWTPEQDAEITKAYIALINDELRKKRNCLIVASADVNPLTEVALSHAYTKNDEEPGPCFKESDPESEERNVVIALKEAGKTNPRRRFSRNTIPGKNRESVAPDQRGFFVRGQSLLKPYSSQDKAKTEFHVLAHLLVMRNPFPAQKGQEEGMIVVLNGVSGPGTYAIAQMLTGSATGEKARDAERLLREINRLWDNDVEPNRRLRGVEAIVDVTIFPPPEPGKPSSTHESQPGNATQAEENSSKEGKSPDAEDSPALPNGTMDEVRMIVQDKFYDKRIVKDWDLVQVPPSNKEKRALIKTFPVLD